MLQNVKKIKGATDENRLKGYVKTRPWGKSFYKCSSPTGSPPKNFARRSIHTCDLLGMNYYVNYSHDYGLYCTKFEHSHLRLSKVL